MAKIFLLLAVSLAVIQSGAAANADRKKNDNIMFIDSIDDSEPIREKIRTEMDNYKKIKEMMFKNKLMNVTMKATTAASTEAPSTTAAPSTTTIPPEVAASKPSVVSSSTIRRVVIAGVSDVSDEDIDESPPTDVIYDDTTISSDDGNSTLVDDRFILNAPAICKNGRVPDQNGICRQLTNF